jgi:hypothetical protein
MLRAIFIVLVLFFINVGLLRANLSFDDTVNMYGSVDYSYDNKNKSYLTSRIDNRFITSYVIDPSYGDVGFKAEAHLLSSYSRNLNNGFLIPINLVITDDKTNLFNLTRVDTLYESSNYTNTLINRIDRLYFSVFNDNYEVTAGRSTVTWSRGRIFHVSDFFNPQTPAFYDSDYKIGTDLIYLNYSLDSNSNLSVVANPKRNYSTEDVTWKDSTFAIRYFRSNSNSDYSISLAQYLRDYALSFGSSLDFFYSSVFRVDTSFWLTEEDRGKVYPSVMLALEKSDYYFDYSTTIYLEYYHNGFGRDNSNESISNSMLKRVENKDTYLVGKDYFSIGAIVELTSYLNLNYSNIISLNDYSLFNLTSITYSYSTNLDLGVSYMQSIGNTGDEFGKNCNEQLNVCYSTLASVMLSITYNF